jgi:hypothetical protein
MRILALSVLLIALLGAGAWAFERQARAGNEQPLSAVATELAGRPVQVRCQSFWRALVDVGGNLGDVPFPGAHPASYTHLTRTMCQALTRFRQRHSQPELDCLGFFDWSRYDGTDPAAAACSHRAGDTAEALMTLAHESMHLRGWADEATAQCYGIQEVAFTVEQLGGSPGEGTAVASYMLGLQRWMPEEYQSGECRPGGQLDLHPETPAFPTESPPAARPPGLHGPQL